MGRWWLAIALLAMLLISNRWVSWDEGVVLLSLSDVTHGYLPIAEAAPFFPSEAVAIQHAQRFAFPYLVGLLGQRILGIHLVFYLITFLAQSLGLVIIWRTLSSLKVAPTVRLVAVGVFLFSPYSFRYYWLAPGMVVDSLFLLGEALILRGFFLGRFASIFVGLALATLSRQTTLLLLPGLVFGFTVCSPWKALPLSTRILRIATVAGLVSSLYLLTVLASRSFSLAGTGNSHLHIALMHLLEGRFGLRQILEHFVRCLLPIATPLALLFAARPRNWTLQTWSMLFLSGVLIAQPLAFGPIYTGQNASRLATFALLPLILGWVSIYRNTWSEIQALMLLVFLFLGSFHHIYTVIGPPSSAWTAALQGLVALGAFILCRRAQLGSQFRSIL